MIFEGVILDLCQFGIVILPLHIETGRFRDERIDERVCLLCNSGEVENEIHFLCVAPHILTTGKICIQLLIIMIMITF